MLAIVMYGLIGSKVRYVIVQAYNEILKAICNGLLISLQNIVVDKSHIDIERYI